MLVEEAAFLDPEFEDMEALELPNEPSDPGFCLSHLAQSNHSDSLNANPYLQKQLWKSKSTSRLPRRQNRKLTRQNSLPTFAEETSASSPSDFLHPYT